MEVDGRGFEVLDREECLRLLDTATIGRIGFTSKALPNVLPVNFAFDGERILIRTGSGSELDAATRNAVVAFQVDSIDSALASGWSVVVTGVAREVTDSAELAALCSVPMHRWGALEHGRLVSISTELVSGHRLVAGFGGKDVAR